MVHQSCCPEPGMVPAQSNRDFDCDDMYPASDAWNRKVTLWNALKGTNSGIHNDFARLTCMLKLNLTEFRIYHGSPELKHCCFPSPLMCCSRIDVLRRIKMKSCRSRYNYLCAHYYLRRLTVRHNPVTYLFTTVVCLTILLWLPVTTGNLHLLTVLTFSIIYTVM